MDTKMNIVEKIVDKKCAAFENIVITIVDANGNKLLNKSRYGQKAGSDQMIVTSEMEKRGIENKNDVLICEQTEVPEEQQKYENALGEKLMLEKEDIAVISRFLGLSKRQMFTTKLKSSNFLCFTDCSGLLICRGNFNRADKNAHIDCVNEDDDEYLQDIPDNDGPFKPSSPILVAGEVSGVIIIAMGESSSDYSIVDVVKEIRNVLI
jgi:hypothetical protein